MHQVPPHSPLGDTSPGGFLSLLLRELKSSDFTLICAAAVLLLPKEKSVDQAVWPVPDSIEVPAPGMGAQSLVRPCFLPEEDRNYDIAQLVDSDGHLMGIML